MRTSRHAFAIVEFALVVPLLLFLVAGAVDYSMLMRAAIGVGDAARAGAEYGSLSAANAGDVAGMQNAVLAAAPDINHLSASAARVCQCSDGTAVNCVGGTCISGPVRTYVQVTAQATVPSLLSYPPLPFGGAVIATATMRAQ